MARTKSSSALSFVVVISLAAIKAAVLHPLSAPHRRLASMSRSPSPFGGPDAFDNFGAGGKLHATQGASGTAALPGQPMHRLPAGHLKQKARAWANLRAKTRATAESQAKAKAVGAMRGTAVANAVGRKAKVLGGGGGEGMFQSSVDSTAEKLKWVKQHPDMADELVAAANFLHEWEKFASSHHLRNDTLSSRLVDETLGIHVGHRAHAPAAGAPGKRNRGYNFESGLREERRREEEQERREQLEERREEREREREEREERAERDRRERRAEREEREEREARERIWEPARSGHLGGGRLRSEQRVSMSAMQPSPDSAASVASPGQQSHSMFMLFGIMGALAAVLFSTTAARGRGYRAARAVRTSGHIHGTSRGYASVASADMDAEDGFSLSRKQVRGNIGVGMGMWTQGGISGGSDGIGGGGDRGNAAGAGGFASGAYESFGASLDLASDAHSVAAAEAEAELEVAGDSAGGTTPIKAQSERGFESMVADSSFS